MKTSIPVNMVRRYPDSHELFEPDASLIKQYEAILDHLPKQQAEVIDWLVSEIVRCRTAPLDMYEYKMIKAKLEDEG
jgi:hypothetical protein